MPAAMEGAQTISVSTNLPGIHRGALFKTFAEFTSALELWKRQHCHAFRIASSERLRRPDGKVDETFAYKYIVYHCVHYGKPRLRGVGKRPNQNYMPCGCRAMLRVNYSYGDNALRITTLREEHSGHETSPSAFANDIAKRRRLSPCSDSSRDTSPLNLSSSSSTSTSTIRSPVSVRGSDLLPMRSTLPQVDALPMHQTPVIGASSNATSAVLQSISSMVAAKVRELSSSVETLTGVDALKKFGALAALAHAAALTQHSAGDRQADTDPTVSFVSQRAESAAAFLASVNRNIEESPQRSSSAGLQEMKTSSGANPSFPGNMRGFRELMIAVSRMPADGADGDFVRSFKRRTQVFMLSKLAERLASTEILEAPEFEAFVLSLVPDYQMPSTEEVLSMLKPNGTARGSFHP